MTVDGSLIEVILFIAGFIGGWILTRKSKPTADTLEEAHALTVEAETKRAKAKKALATVRHQAEVKRLERKSQAIEKLDGDDLAAKVRDVFGGKK